MALAGLNHKLAGHNLSAHDITGILIGSIYVGVRFPAHDSMIFRNGLVAFFCPARPIRRWRLLGSSPSIAPVLLISDSCSFFGGQLRIFDHATHCTGDGVALSGNIFHGTPPELVGHAPPLKHREVSHAQQALTAEFFGCQLPHDRGEREIFFSEPLRWLNTFDGRKNRFIFIQGSLARVLPAPCAPLAWGDARNAPPFQPYAALLVKFHFSRV